MKNSLAYLARRIEAITVKNNPSSSSWRFYCSSSPADSSPPPYNKLFVAGFSLPLSSLSCLLSVYLWIFLWISLYSNLDYALCFVDMLVHRFVMVSGREIIEGCFFFLWGGDWRYSTSILLIIVSINFTPLL